MRGLGYDLAHPDPFTYTDRVKAAQPTYYWSMQAPTRSARNQECWVPDAGTKFLVPQSSGIGSETSMAAVDGPFGQQISAAGLIVSGTVQTIACYESSDGLATGAGTVNANRNTTGYSYMIWARNLDLSLADSAYASNWTTNAGSMLYVHTGTDLRVYHNGSFSALVGYKDALWHHWCVTWDGTTQVTYRDGVSINSVARAGALGSALKMSAGYYNFNLSTDARMALCHFAWWEQRALDVGTVRMLARTA